MSGFSRFVAYINLYEESSKVRNVGFAKIERRSEQCKIEIHMKGCGYTGVSCPVYFFVRKEDETKGILIGKMAIQNGVGEFRKVLGAENIEGSRHGFKEVGGLIIIVNETIMFASQWDEKGIRRDRFSPFEIEARAPVPVQAPTPVNAQVKPLEASTPISPAMPMKAQTKAPMPVAKDSPSGKRKDISATEAGVHRAPYLHLPTEPMKQEENWAERWQFILENYPVLTPFEGEENILCVRIELKDLRMLPKRYWYLGNNSFLLHGFFNYRYLILGSMGEKGEDARWFIGVPGVFQSQEKVMAAIFGFPEYKSEKIGTQKTGQFGYWYRFMEE